LKRAILIQPPLLNKRANIILIGKEHDILPKLTNTSRVPFKLGRFMTLEESLKYPI
jgi:hypothetical protein